MIRRLRIPRPLHTSHRRHTPQALRTPHRQHTPVRSALAALILVAATTGPALAQQSPALRVLDHSDYDRWERVTDYELSDDGRWISWTETPGRGDPSVHLARTDGSGSWTLERASAPRFVGDGGDGLLALTLHPAHAVVDSLRRADTPRDELPADTLGIVRLDELSNAGDGGALAPLLRRVPDLDRWLAPESGTPRIAVLLETPSGTDDASDAAAGSDESPEEGDDEQPANGGPLVLIDPFAGSETRFENVTDAHFSGDGAHLWLVIDAAGKDDDGVRRVDAASGQAEMVHTAAAEYGSLAVQAEGSRIAFLARPESAEQEPSEASAEAEQIGRAHV